MPHEAAAARPPQRRAGSTDDPDRLRQLFDLNLAGIYRTTWDGIMLECNTAFARMLGHESAAELEGQPIHHFYHRPSDRQDVLLDLERDPSPTAREICLRDEHGATVWILATAMRVTGEGGAREIEGTVVDITSTKQTTDALLESEARFRSVVQAAGAPIVCTELEQRITQFNPAAERVFGMPREDAIGRVYASLFPPAMRAKVSADLNRVAHGADIAAFENLIERPDGAKTVVLWNIQPLCDADGRRRGVVVVGQDITERQRAEESLLRQARYLRALTATDRAILAVQRPEAIANAVLRHMDALLPCRGAAVIAYDVDAAEAHLLASIGTPQRTIPAVSPLPRTSMVVEPRIDADGSGSRRLQMPLLVKGTAIGVLVIHQADRGLQATASEIELAGQIADRLALALHNWRLFQNEGDARRRLAAVSNRLVDVQETERRLLARELHDEVGQSLTALKFQLELAASAGEPLAIERAAALVNDLIQQVRNLSLDLRPAILDDFGLLPALVWHVERVGQLTGVTVRLEHGGLEPRLPQRLENAAYRIVQEGLTNVARHAGAKDARVSVRANGAELILEVEDCGIGFDAAVTPQPPSTGLSGMRERATLLGGELVVVSAPGRGTLIRASFPLHGPRGDAASSPGMRRR